MLESGWEVESGGLAAPATREDLLTAIASIDAILIRATIVQNGGQTVLRFAKDHL